MMNTILLCLFLFLQSCNTNDMMKPPVNQQSIINAVRNGQLQVVTELLKKGTDVNTVNKNEASLLLIATRANNFEMAKLLVAHGANVNQQDDMRDSPFLYAGAAGYTEMVKLFLLNGARFDVFNRYKGSALIPACERGHLETVKLLANTKSYPIDHVNRLGWTALLEAVILGDGSKKYAEVVQVLVDAGCNINIPDSKGVTALQHAKANGYAAIVAVLEKG